MKKLSVTGVLLLAAYALTCLGTERQTKIIQTENEPPELVLMMRQMEEQMKSIKTQIQETNAVNDTLYKDYSGIFTVTASPHIHRDSTFVVFGNQFLETFEKLTRKNKEADIAKQYNLTVESCITCHRSYCPGPVMRISKLKLRGR